MPPSRAMLLVLLAGCSARDSFPARRHVAAELEHRIAHTIPLDQPADTPIALHDLISYGIDPRDGLTEDEAVGLALCNNAAFAEALAELGIARADFVQAGLLTNPVLAVLFPLGPKQLEFTALFPLEALWLRPRREQIAELDLERVASRLVQTGLDLTRDVRLAYADYHGAVARSELANRGVKLLEEVARVADARVQAGEASELEGSAARMEVLRAKEEQARLSQAVAAAELRIANLVGHDFSRPITISDPRPVSTVPLNLDEIAAGADAARPDLRGAELAVEAACRRADLATKDYLLVAAMLDANGEGENGFEAGPGLQVTLPVFHCNDGAVLRARAELDRSIRQHRTIKDRIHFEVRDAFLRYDLARFQLHTWQNQILPQAETTVQTARRGFQEGDATYLFLLETVRHLLDARVRAVESEANLRRALAELERGAGQRLDFGPTMPPLEVKACASALP